LRGEDIAAFSRRTGVRERLVVAIDEGRFGDLPTGLYARTAVRLYARGVALDVDEVLAACEPLLPVLEDPVSALARLRGLKPAPVRTPPSSRPVAGVGARPVAVPGAPDRALEPCPFPPWKPLAAVALDGFVVATLLLVAVAGTMTLSGGRAASLGPTAAPVFALLGLLLGTCYFLFFGGIACATAGERLVGMRVGRRSPRHIDPRTVAARAVRCAGRDIRYLVRLGAWAATVLPWDSASEESGAPSIGHAAGQ
jgi:Helix-turn-helix domain/RDD family